MSLGLLLVPTWKLVRPTWSRRLFCPSVSSTPACPVTGGRFPDKTSHFDSITVCSTCTLLLPPSHSFVLAPGGTAQLGPARLLLRTPVGKTWRRSRRPHGCQDRDFLSVRVPERQKAKVSRQIERRAVASPNLINDGTEGNRRTVQVMETTW